MYEQVEAIREGKVKGLVVFGANPVVSYPDANRVQSDLEAAEFLMVMDIFPTPTTDLAHLVLPATSFAESDGTFSSSERRVQRVRPAIPPIAGKTNWEVIQELSTRMGYPMNYRSGEEIFDEMASLTPAYGGMTFARLNEKGLCWPCPTPDHPGTQYLHKENLPGAGPSGHRLPAARGGPGPRISSLADHRHPLYPVSHRHHDPPLPHSSSRKSRGGGGNQSHGRPAPAHPAGGGD
jgi:predicted molibdopterin-dependent oxidoreductase YjgC